MKGGNSLCNNNRAAHPLRYDPFAGQGGIVPDRSGGDGYFDHQVRRCPFSEDRRERGRVCEFEQIDFEEIHVRRFNKIRRRMEDRCFFF